MIVLHASRMSSTRKCAESYAHFNRGIQQNLFQKLLSFVAIKPGFKCLDIGCGTGNNTVHLADKVGTHGFVTGIDPDEDRINVAKEEYKRENVDYVVGKSTCLPPCNGGYDLVVSNCVMHWITYEEKIKTYTEVSKLLKDGGVFAICEVAHVPDGLDHRCILYDIHEFQGLVFHFLDIEENRKIFEDLEFEIVTMQNEIRTDVFESLGLFLDWATATVNQDVHKLYEQNKELITMDKDGSVISKNGLNYIIVRKL